MKDHKLTRWASEGLTFRTAVRCVAIAALNVMMSVWSPSDAHAAQPPSPNTLPTGGQITAGQATVNQSGSLMTIKQGSFLWHRPQDTA